MGNAIKIGKHKKNHVNQVRLMNLVKRNDEILKKYKEINQQAKIVADSEDN